MKWDECKVHVPEAVGTYWAVRRFEVSKQDADLTNMRLLFHPGSASRLIYPGRYTGLYRLNGKRESIVMSDTRAEVIDHLWPWREARDRGGRVLIHGLGLGMFLGMVLRLDNVTEVTVVELSKEVIELVGSTYTKDPRVTIIHGDALTWQPPVGSRWSIVWHDIWDTICGDNWEVMKTLHRRFGNRADWQSSWSREHIIRERRNE